MNGFVGIHNLLAMYPTVTEPAHGLQVLTVHRYLRYLRQLLLFIFLSRMRMYPLKLLDDRLVLQSASSV